LNDQVTSIFVQESHGIARAGAPVRLGVPLPRGRVRRLDDWTVHGRDNVVKAHQLRPLARWSDGSVKWALIDVSLDISAHAHECLTLQARKADTGGYSHSALAVGEEEREIKVDSGETVFVIGRQSPAIFDAVRIDGIDVTAGNVGELSFIDRHGHGADIAVHSTFVEERGPARVSIVSDGEIRCRKRGVLRFRMRRELFVNWRAARVEVQLTNPRAARHPGGLWDLGDAGSHIFEDFSLRVRPREAVRELECHLDGQRASAHTAVHRWTLYQDSSGGERWNSSNHVDRSGTPSVNFRGYEIRAESNQGRVVLSRGHRVQPLLKVLGEGFWIAATVEHFWQNFPKALRWTGDSLSIGLFPTECDREFELQGGEQKRHVVFLEFGRTQDDVLLKHWQHPLAVWIDPQAVAQSGAVTYFIPQAQDPNEDYVRYVSNIIEGPNSFFAKRELIDEYGWRNFGDLYADHEAVGHAGPEPLVSHYNNQYDFIYGALVHHLRTGDGRWLQLGRESAQHTIDIDIYHTDQDKAAFNGGLFWHTDHYRDARTCTHRTYSRHNAADANYGGGPSNEHNYTSGLLLYHYLSGDVEAKRAVVQLAEWVIAMDDGENTILSVLNCRPTGAATKTRSESFHGPGRGAGNSINALMDAYLLTGENRFMLKAQELIARCIHPRDDISALGLDDPESRWSYLVFLQVLGKFLELKTELREFDYTFHYARESLLHYAQWMLENECPYQEVLHKVEIPNETWPAQDVRKSHVLHVAAEQAEGELRERCRQMADDYFKRALQDVLSFPTAYLTRPLVLSCVFGFVDGYYKVKGYRPARVEAHNYEFGMPVSFLPQKQGVGASLRRRMRLIQREIGRIGRDKLHALATRLGLRGI
jgi:hypothetical protein